jgi:hypothetical protein
MKKIKYLFFVAVILLPVFSSAQIISEINYSPKTNAWIEIYNNTSSSIDLTQYKIFDAGAQVNGHTIKFISGNSILPAYSYAVVSTSNAVSKYFSSVAYPVFQSALSPNTSGDTILLKSGSNTADTVLFSNTQGANGDGNTLQKQPDNTWLAAAPTPGAVNSNIPLAISDGSQNSDATTTASTTDQTNSNSQNSNQTDGWFANASPASLPSSQAPVNFEISAGRDRLSSVSNDLLFLVTPVEMQGISASQIYYTWSFGDGTTASGNSVHHSYKFPGEYSVVVNASALGQLAVDRLTVKVIDPQISLEKVSGGTEVSNNSEEEINLECWILFSGDKYFTFPQDTLISANQKIIFADDVTGMDNANLQIKNQLGKIYASTTGQNLATSSIEIATTTSVEIKNADNIITTVSNSSQKVSVSDAKINSVANNEVEPVVVSPNVQQSDNSKSVSTQNFSTLEQNSVNIGTSTIENADQTATVFIASSSPGIISKIFSWPIRSFNFLRSLFEEK